MLHKTRGIVLNYIKYRETSIIARIYTEQFGLQSYIINSVRSQKSKKGLALLQPLTILDMVVYHKNTKTDGLQRISEYKPALTFKNIPFQIKKSSIALFVTELLANITKEEEEQGAMFEFLYSSIIQLDNQESRYESIHVFVMIKLTRYIGFGIQTKNELQNDTVLPHVKSDLDSIYNSIIELNNSTVENTMIDNGLLRKDCLNYMLSYYFHHVEGFSEMKSIEILNQIFR